MATEDGVYYPDSGSVTADIPLEMLKVAQSLRGRTNRTFASTSDRDTAVAALPAAARQGAIVYTSARGWQGYTSAAASYSTANWQSFEQVKRGRMDTTIEGNGSARIPSSLCFFDGAAPTSIVAMGINEAFMPVWNGFSDGAGSLLKIWNPTANGGVGAYWGPGAAVAFFWIACR